MEETKEPSIGISLRCVLPNQQELVLQSFVERDCDVPRLDGLLDKLRVAAERQLAFGGLREMKTELKKLEKIAIDHAARMEIVDANIKAKWDASNRKGEIKLTAQEEAAQLQSVQYAEDTKNRITEVKKNIAELERVVGA